MLQTTTKLELARTDFELTLNKSRIIRSSTYPNSFASSDFILHEAVASNYIIVNGKKLYCEYKTGQDYYCRNNRFDICGDQSNDLVSELDNLVEFDFEGENGLENTKRLEGAHALAKKEFGNKISTNELFDIYQFFKTNHPRFACHSFKGHSSSPNNYIIDEDSGTATLRNKA